MKSRLRKISCWVRYQTPRVGIVGFNYRTKAEAKAALRPERGEVLINLKGFYVEPRGEERSDG